ncbi:MAG: metal-binding protein [Pyrinomonadaceae bacterium]
MPSGKTHDLITALVAPPTLLAVWWLTGDWLLACVATGATLFGGLMFGPDLDIHSKQYTRWGPFRFLWLPYQITFRHRSRWSHGIVFGTLIRVVYFAAVLTLLACLAVYLRATFVAGTAPDYGAVLRAWQVVGEGFVSYGFDRRDLWALLAGFWWGAASHTFTDVFWSIVRKGSEIF